MKMLSMLLAILLASASVSFSHAGVMVSAVRVRADDERNFGGFISRASHLIDQNGLSRQFVSGTTDFDDYVNSNPTHRTTR